MRSEHTRLGQTPLEQTSSRSGRSHGPDQVLDGIWAAVPTPFEADGELDLRGLEKNAAHYAGALGLDGIFCHGLMGEGWALSVAERKRALEATLSGGGGLRIGIVTSHHSLGETLDLSRHAAQAGAHHVVLTRPAGLFSESDVVRYVKMVAEAISIPVVLHDNGGFPASVTARLAADGLVHGVKCTRDADAIVEVRTHCPETITIADPCESRWLGNLLRFDLRALYADPEPYLYQLANCHPIRDYFGAYQRNDLAAATDIYRTLEPLRVVYERWIMTPLRAGQPINAALKHWCRRLGLAAGPVRAPLQALTAEQERKLDADLTAAYDAVFGGKVQAQEWKS